MIKSELISKLVSVFKDIPEKDISNSASVLLDSMATSLSEGKRIEIRGFGSFKVRQYKGRKGRNPKTGQEILVKPKVLPIFKVSKLMRARINKDLE